MAEEIVNLGDIRVDLAELANFLAKAKKACYASDRLETRAEDGSKVLTFQEGNFHYTDNYDGYYLAPGSEIVRWQKPTGQRIWQMSYSGGMLMKFIGREELAKDTFAFLKKALSQVTPECPFRGPEGFDWTPDEGDKNFCYRAKTQRDITSFSGKERIECNLTKYPEFPTPYWRTVFEQEYMGGLVVPKRSQLRGMGGFLDEDLQRVLAGDRARVNHSSETGDLRGEDD